MGVETEVGAKPEISSIRLWKKRKKGEKRWPYCFEHIFGRKSEGMKKVAYPGRLPELVQDSLLNLHHLELILQ